MRMPAVGITCYASQGGSGVVASELGLHLARRGCEVHFIASQLPFRLQQYNENIIYHPVDLPSYPVFQHSPYTLTLEAIDPGADTVREWTIDWGDGSTDTTPRSPVSITHIYADDGLYTTAVHLWQDTGLSIAIHPTVTVHNRAPGL